MIVSVKNNYASLNYFYKENDAGYISVNNTPFFNNDEDITIFYTDNGNIEIEIINYSIITFELAKQGIKEFFETKSLPQCIEWEKL